MTVTSHPTAPALAPDTGPTAANLRGCLNCGALLTGGYCAACGQPKVELDASTWHVAREWLSDATDLDGRVLRTARALLSPGRLTTEFLRGRRIPYIGPIKLFLVAGAVISTTWVFTRGIDSHYYGLPTDTSAATYIDQVVRASLAAAIAIALTSWALALGRRRLIDQAVFALHLVAALSLLASIVIWIATGWKVVWGTYANAPSALPSLVYLFFLPAAVLGAVYVVAAVRRVQSGRWWAVALRAFVLGAVALGAAFAVLFR